MSNLFSFESPREVKWCPGCGNYAVLMTLQKTLYSLGLNNANTVFISGIGCSGRYPYYINANGFHTLHGRATCVATGLSLCRKDLSIWVFIGDGDGFSIGLGHVLHLIRRNINVRVIFINNKVYALTKGQYSPTTEKGVITKSSPYGVVEDPINPLSMVLNAGCTFVSRVVDTDSVNLRNILIAASKHRGTAFIEVLQNCNVFNNAFFSDVYNNDENLDNILFLEDNEQLFFGKNKDKKLKLDNDFSLKVVDYNVDSSLIYDVKSFNNLQIIIGNLPYFYRPYPFGIFRNIIKPTYDDLFLENTINNNNFSNLESFLSSL